MIVNAPELAIFSLEHLEAFATSCGPALDRALAASHHHCGEGFASNDRGASNRSFVLSTLDNCLTPWGLVITKGEGPTRPVHTTWLEIPTPLGAESVMVNCVKVIGADRYRLVGGDAGAVPSFMVQPNLWPEPNQIVDVMIGINWSARRQRRGEPLKMRARVYLLGGFLDRDARIFHSADKRDLWFGEYGGGQPRVTPVGDPAGPQPTLQRA